MKNDDRPETESREENKAENSKSHKLLYAVILIFLLSVAWFALVIWYKVIPHELHYHAGFIVVKDGQLVDFSKPDFMEIIPCVIEGSNMEHTPQEQQAAKGHLHDNVGDVVHVEAENAKWKDLFTNIDYPINYSETTAYINGKKVQDLQNQLIKPYQSAVIFIGKTEDTQRFLDQKVTKSHIKEEEGKSEDCGMNHI